MKRRMLVELEKMASAAGFTEDGQPVTPIDVVCDYIAEGTEEDGTLHTLAELARELTDKAGNHISAAVLSNWVNSRKEWKAKIAAARALAAHVFAEQSVQVLDELSGTEVTREEVSLARERANVRQWLASKWNRGTYGADSAVTINNNQINVPGAHLEAIRARSEREKLKAVTQPQLPPPEPDYEYVPSDLTPQQEGEEIVG